MAFIRLTFLIFSLCFMAQQVVEVLRIAQKQKITWTESENNVDGSEEDLEEQMSEVLLSSETSDANQPLGYFDDRNLKNFRSVFYDEFHGGLTTPPPDNK